MDKIKGITPPVMTVFMRNHLTSAGGAMLIQTIGVLQISEDFEPAYLQSALFFI